MIIFKTTILGRPPSKKNTQKVVRRHGYTHAIYTELFRSWEKVALLTLKKAHIGHETINIPLEASFKFFFTNHSGEADVSNLIEAPQDALTKAGVIVDDRIIQVLRASKHFGEEPRTEIELRTIEEEVD